MIKRLFDICFSLIGLLVGLPIMAVAAILIVCDNPGPIIYKGERVGKNGKVFNMYKFRTMVVNADKIGGPSTAADDPRLTKVGKFLRKYKIDEVPQFINILQGNMSFVGPRPEVPSEVAIYNPEVKRIIFSVKPGFTDLAALADLHEEEILQGSSDPHQTYKEKIQPQKLKLQVEYVKRQSFWLDIKILVKTFLNVVLHK